MRHDTFPTNEMMQKYKNVFSHREAKDVLYHMLFEMGYFKQSSTPEETAVRNYATRLLEIIGGGEIRLSTVENFRISLINQPLPKEDKE